MKNPYLTPTDFWQERDFGAKISATFDFIGAHWRRLGKCLVYFVLPFALLLGIGLGLVMNPIYNQMGKTMAAQRAGHVAAAPASPFALFNLGGIGLSAVAGVLAFLLLLSTVYGYLRARLDLPATEPVTPAAVWAQIRQRLGRMAAVVGLLFVGYLGLLFGYTLVLGLLVRGGAGGGGTVGVFFLGFFGLLLLITYLGVVLTLYFPVLWLEDQSIFGAVGRSFQLIRGHWWATFGLLIVVAFIQGGLSIVFIVPFYGVMFGKMFQLPGFSSDLAGVAAMTFYASGIIFTYVVSLLTAAFQYFNLAEQREGHGLHLLVAELGHPQGGPTAFSHHYRPDEEGEY